MNVSGNLSALIILGSFSAVSCEEPQDPVIKAVEETEELLQEHEWQLTEFLVTVRNEDIPPPFLAGAANGLLGAGSYNLVQISGEIDDVTSYQIQFTDKTIEVDTSGSNMFIENGTYKVFTEDEIRMNLGGGTKLRYAYIFSDPNRTMLFDADESTAGLVIDGYNRALTRLVVSETPDRIGDTIARLLFENDQVQEALNQFLVDLISGKLSVLNEIDPEAQADSVATAVFEAIELVDWKTILSDAIEAKLEKITSIDAEELSQEIALEAVDIISAELSTETIFNFILPFFNRLDEQPELELAEQIAIVITAVILNIFDQEKLEEIILPIWEQFTQLDEATTAQVADSLATIVEKNVINQDSLSDKFLPATQKITATPITQLDDLAEEIVDSLEVQVDKLNTQFPDLNLAPNYNNIRSAVTAALIGLKPIINTIGAADAADQIANLIITDFLDHQTLVNAFISGINFLQSIDPALAATRISEWLINLEGDVDQALIDFLTTQLSPILQDFDPELSAFQIAQTLNQFIESTITQEFVFDIVFPKVQALTQINSQEAGDYIAGLILESEIINNNVTKENLEAALLPVLADLKNIDPDEAASSIIQAIVSNELIKETITEDRVNWIISYVLYNAVWDQFKQLNNFQSVSIAIRHD